MSPAPALPPSEAPPAEPVAPPHLETQAADPTPVAAEPFEAELNLIAAEPAPPVAGPPNADAEPPELPLTPSQLAPLAVETASAVETVAPQTDAEHAGPAPAVSEPALAQALAVLGEGATFVYKLDASSRPVAAAPQLRHEILGGEGAWRLRLSDGDPKAPSFGHVGGFSVRLPDEIEKAASGRAVTLRVLGRSPDGPQARAACAYSTNDVGNSGWRWLTFSPEWRTSSFIYNVPPMKNGNGDFVGLLADAPGAPAVEIAGFAIDIAE